MRTTAFRSLSLAAAAVMTLSGSATAQERTSGLLNSLEVRQLVERSEPADHVRLAAHYTALGDRYAGEAKRHMSMSQSFIGNPSRNLGTGMSAHCKQLTNLNVQSETTVRELAAYHAKLASGTPATPPRDGARFQGGAGSPEPTQKRAECARRKSHTPAEHRGLQQVLPDPGQAIHRRSRGACRVGAGVSGLADCAGGRASRPSRRSITRRGQGSDRRLLRCNKQLAGVPR